METKYKKTLVLEGLNYTPYDNHVMLLGITTQSVIGLSNDDIDKDTIFKWFVVGYGEVAFVDDLKIELKDNVTLTKAPDLRIEITGNKETIKEYKELFTDLSQFDRAELHKAHKEINNVLVKEYFLVPSYMVIGNHDDIKLDSYIEEVKANLKPDITEAGVIIPKV